MGRITHGAIAEHWGVQDNLSMFQQLGVIPSKDNTAFTAR
jgi:hypothetical protein